MISIKKLFEPTDMTIWKPWKSILTFSIPMIIGNIAQQLYSTVDSIVVGHYEGDTALAAVGSALPLFNLLLVLFVGISAGVGIMVAQYFGAKAREELSSTIGTCITITAIASLFLMVAAPPIIKPVLSLFNTPKEILNDCTNYLVIMMYGAAGMAYYNILGGILRGLGDSFSSLLYLLVATVINIILDIYFVANLDMGVAGVAWATVIAQFISSALCLLKLVKLKEHFTLGLKELKISGRHCSQLIRLGIPTGLTQAIFSSAMLVVQSLTNCFGVAFIAANNIVMRVDGFAMMPNFSFGTAMTTYAGQNVGARRLDRVSQGAKEGTFMAVACSAFITFVILLFGKHLMAIFTKNPETVELSYYIMKILAVGYIAMAVTQSLSGVMRGAGDTMTPMWISLITTIIIRVPVAYIISWATTTDALPNGRFECIPVSLLCSWVIGAALTALFYRIGKWKSKAIRV
ncbi:MAG: MATE family efflux transporter [Ruminococcaceae bacterium]|nr:MATE family efflux transporter [Oscillospiraceae bacterium]